MNYEKKIEYAKRVAELIKKGKSELEVQSFLELEGIDKFQMNKVRKSAREFVKEEYGEQIRHLMLANELENHLDDYDELDSEIFEEIQYDQIRRIQANCGEKVREMMVKGSAYEEVIDSCINQFYSQEDVEREIERYNYYNSKVDDKVKSTYQFRGVIFIVLGIILTSASMNYLGNAIILFYGMILYGVWCIFKSYMTQSDIDSSEESGY